jgi:serine/threonine-protein kinase
VPDLSGLNEDDAAHALAKAGLLASIFFVPSSDPLGTVEGQAKQQGTTVRYRSHVQVNVSKGPGTKPSEQVPNVVGKSLQQAVASLNGANLRLIYVTLPQTTKAGVGKIAQQSPLAGSRAPQNAQVVVYLAVYRPSG